MVSWSSAAEKSGHYGTVFVYNFQLVNKCQEHNSQGIDGSDISRIHTLICTPPPGPKGRGVALIWQHGGCYSIFSGVFGFNFDTTHKYRLLQVPTVYLSYYRLLHITSVNYCKVTVDTMFDMVNIGYYRLQCVYHLL